MEESHLLQVNQQSMDKYNTLYMQYMHEHQP
jgi:hypothetical protein